MPTTATPTHIAARVGDREITLEEMDRAIGLRLSETRSSLREEWLDLQVLEAEALKKGLDVRQLLRQEISVDPISQQDIDRFYEMNRERMPADVPRARLDPQIRDQLRRDAGQQAQVEYIGQLRLRYGAALVRPPVERFAIDANPRGGPERGPADAPITIVAFSDLECSYCAHSHRQLEELQRERPDDLRLVFRHYPLRMHANARLAAEVAACAHQQDRFWPLVEVLFENQTRLEIDRVRGHAMALGLDMLQLDGCLQSGVGAGIVNADVAEADELGVSSTPAFFINGHFVKQLPTAAGLEAWIQR
jgi:protein-disulfide isomerase